MKAGDPSSQQRTKRPSTADLDPSGTRAPAREDRLDPPLLYSTRSALCRLYQCLDRGGRCGGTLIITWAFWKFHNMHGTRCERQAQSAKEHERAIDLIPLLSPSLF